MSEKDDLELTDNPFDPRRSTLRSALRAAGPRAWVAAALAIAVVSVGWYMRPANPPEELYRGSPDSVVHLKTTDSRALRLQIIDELHGAGVEATGYQQLGVDGIDADLPRPVPDAVRRVLDQHRIPVPADGVLRVEISPAP